MTVFLSWNYNRFEKSIIFGVLFQDEIFLRDYLKTF